jgi:hypothetical protein
LNIWQCNKIRGNTTDILPPNFKLWQYHLLIATIYMLLQYFWWQNPIFLVVKKRREKKKIEGKDGRSESQTPLKDIYSLHSLALDQRL